MATNTYVALDKVTVTTATPSVTFTGISQAYTDLVIVAQAGTTLNVQEIKVVFNSDTGSNYSTTNLWGNGTTAGSYRRTSDTGWVLDYAGGLNTGITQNFTTVHLMNYANSNVYKTAIVRASSTSYGVDTLATLWRSTAAITSMQLNCYAAQNFAVGSTFSLYGIKSEEEAAKATGGYVTSDSTYFYHTFLASGTFTPKQSLSCDLLLIGGGGSGGAEYAEASGGGAAGQVNLVTGVSASVTAYSVTVGGGGTASTSTAGNLGTSSSVLSQSGATASSAANSYTGGTSGNSYAGGAGNSISGGGGGGAAAVGAAATGDYTTGGGGAGGAGTNAYSSWATVTGTGLSNYYAGGGGGGGRAASSGALGGSGGGGKGGSYANGVAATSATANTGSGGGGRASSSGSSGAGGSGIVIVRYAK